MTALCHTYAIWSVCIASVNLLVFSVCWAAVDKGTMEVIVTLLLTMEKCCGGAAGRRNQREKSLAVWFPHEPADADRVPGESSFGSPCGRHLLQGDAPVSEDSWNDMLLQPYEQAGGLLCTPLAKFLAKFLQPNSNSGFSPFRFNQTIVRQLCALMPYCATKLACGYSWLLDRGRGI